ncbi:MAG: helix-turn-helix transcriptional regulator [Spirochaetes bacterium]|nr:helix-turn-helix transcriptional regulator [Spirochaetota bacterium]
MPSPVLFLSPARYLKELAGGHCTAALEHGGLSSFRRDWGFAPRRIPASILYYVIQGGIRVTLPGDPRGRGALLTPGTLLWIAPWVEHAMALEKPEGATVTWHMRLSVRRGGRLLHPHGDLRTLSDRGDLPARLEELVRASREDGPFAPERLRALAFLFALEALGDGRPEAAQGLSNRQWARLRQWLDGHWDRRPVPAEMAACLDLSPAYFARLFHRTTGFTPRVWLVREKIRLATARLAEGGFSVEAAAKSLAYTDFSLFSRQFKAVMGISPRQFKKRYG